jgi:ligand-binding sensor domain-containing protein/signal transduction histidine kinase/DNA-binding response OmpR family regulator
MKQRIKTFCKRWGLFSLMIFLTIHASPSGIELKQLSTEQGLPGPDVRFIYKDNIGYLWFGIDAAGLCRYDGKNFVTYGHLPEDVNTLSNDFIWNIGADQYNNLWIATENGLNLFDRQHERFFRFYNYPKSTASDNRITSILSGKDGCLWIGTSNGLNKIEAQEIERINRLLTSGNKINQSEINPAFKRYLSGDAYSKSLGIIEVQHIMQDRNTRLWIGTNKGLFLLNTKTNTLKHYTHKEGDLHSLINNSVHFVYECSQGVFVIGTNRGICKYFESEDKFEPLSFNAIHLGSLDLKGYSGFYADSRSNEWITLSGGILVGKGICSNDHTFHYQFLTQDEWGLKSSIIRNIKQDISGQVWIATKFEGLEIYQPDQQLFPFFKIGPMSNKTNRVDDNYVLCLLADSQNNIWISTKSGGLVKYDKQKRKFESYRIYAQPTNSSYSNKFACIYEDSDKEMWFGSTKGLYKLKNKSLHLIPFHKITAICEDVPGHFWIGSEKGLFTFDKKTNVFSRYNNVNPFFKDSSILIFRIVQDQFKNIWFGTQLSGVFVYDHKTKLVKHKRHSISDHQTLSGDMVRSIFNDKSGRLWIGTKDNGLNLYDFQKDIFIHYSKYDGLPSNTIFSMVEDKNGHLWIGTLQGLSMLDPKTMNFINYDESHGLQNNAFEYNAYAQTSDGFLLFGGKAGFNMFHPDSIHFNNVRPPLVINFIKANDKVIKKELYTDTEIELPYDQNYLAFEFALLDFRNPSRNTYKYQLKGVDKGWVETGNRNYVAYPKLKDGKYDFVVKSLGNSYGQIPQTLHVSVRIKPPFWLTHTAYIFYLLLTITSLFGIYRFAIMKANYRFRLTEAKKEFERTKELHQTKLRFFTFVSHEFQAPLTLIMAPIEKLIQSPSISGDERKYIELVQRNTKRLSQLIDQLLYFRKAQNDVIGLKVNEGNIVAFLHEVTYPYSVQAGKHNIHFLFNPVREVLMLWFDPDKMEKIVSNLLMNAFKYTAPGGTVELSITLCEEYMVPFPEKRKAKKTDEKLVKIAVKDTGRGMTKEQAGMVFSRYYRVGNDDQKGVGIGLELTKTLVEMHHGAITIDSEPGLGSTFSVYLRQGKDHYNEKDISPSDFQIKDYLSEIDIDFLNSDDTAEFPNCEIKSNEEKNKPVILIVEDNNDLRRFLGENLNELYNIALADNGISGLEKALRNVPDLIISDVIMPEMDGIEMCKQIKTNIATSHIPIILLTRKAYMEDKITGLLTGAVDYIEKPFNLQYLQLRIQNLFLERQKITRVLKKEIEEGEVKASEISIYDKKLLNRCMKAIMDHLSDTEFGVSELGKEVGLSRSQLHRKITALTGQSPVDLVYSSRLAEAKKMLGNGYSVADVAHLTGFKSSSSFSTVFKNRLGISPTEYVEARKRSSQG